MSMFGNIAVEVELEKLLTLLKEYKHLPPKELLKLLKKRMKDDLEAAKTGWL